MADTDDLREFVPRPFPVLGGEQAIKRFYTDQDKDIARSLKTVIEVMKKLEARIEALEP